MSFIQVIGVTTTRLDEIQQLMDEWVAKTEGKRKAQHSTLTADRDRPDTYVQIVEFPPALPETGYFAEQLAKLCDQAPTFRNLDVRRVDDL